MSAHALLVEPFESLAFMRAALVACLALALANGAVGTLLVLRRMSLDGNVLGHAVMPGAAVGFLYAGPSPGWLSLGGLASGLAVAALAGMLTGGRAVRDAGLVAFYLVALSLGVILVAWRGSNVDVMRVLFGTVLAIDQRALVEIAAVSSAVVLAIAALYRPLAVGAFDPAFLRALGTRRAIHGDVPGAGGAGAGGELPGVWHLVGGGTDAAAGGGGAVLAVGCCGVDGAGDRLRVCRIGRGTAGLLSRQSAVRPSDRARGGIAVWNFARGRRRVAAPGADGGEGSMMLRWVIALVATLLVASPAGAADRIMVVATFSVIGDMLANVGGDRTDIKTIVGAGGDCELYQPTAADVATVASARAVFVNDLNEEFEPWLEPLLKQALFKGVKVVVTRNVRTLTAEEEHPVSGRQLPTAIDQHAWLDPGNGVIYVRNIVTALARLDPANAALYRERAAEYAKQIQAVDDWARQEIAGVPAAKRRALASHDSLQYIANAYGITLLSVNGWTNNSEPSAAELAKLARQIQADHVKALFLDSITDPRAMQRIAGETGAVIGGTLYGDSLSPAGGEADSYIAMLRHDVTTLKAGMLRN